MDRIDFLGFALLLRDMSGLDRYSTRHLFEVLNPGLNVNVILAGVQIDSRAVWSVAARLYVPTSLYRYRHI